MLGKSHLRQDGLILAHSLRVLLPQWEMCDTEGRKQLVSRDSHSRSRERRMLLISRLSPFYSDWDDRMVTPTVGEGFPT